MGLNYIVHYMENYPVSKIKYVEHFPKDTWPDWPVKPARGQKLKQPILLTRYVARR